MPNPNIVLIGRLGQEPSPIGDNGIRLRMVTNDRRKNEETGKYEDSATSWWTIKVWGNLANQTRNSIKKGQEIVVSGTIYEDRWTDKSGVEKTSYEVRADSVGLTTYSLSKENAKDRFFDEVETPF
jgi:single-strand DNA-binding protein